MSSPTSSSSDSAATASSSGSDSESEQRRTIKESYAKAIALKRKRAEEDEERQRKRQARIAEQPDEDESEEEDDDGWDEGPAADAALLKTLALIQRKDPAIYDSSKPVFEEARKQLSESSPAVHRAKKEKSHKPVTYKTQAAAALLGRGNDEEAPRLLTHVEEQAALRSETISAFHGAVENDDDLFTLRDEIKDDVDMEQDEYKEFVQREVGEVLPPTATEDATGNEADTFLTNYLLNRSWIDHKARRLPTFDEITSKGRTKDELDAEGDDDSDFEELEEDFEATYNFRFEEPDGSKIPRYPREIDSLARRKESARKEARDRKKARKEEEFKKKKEEVRRMKNAKSKELKNKVLELFGGDTDGDRKSAKKTLASFNLDDDFDPESWDKQMAALYEDGEDEDIEKPEWPEDDDAEILDGAGDQLEDAETQQHGDGEEQTSGLSDRKRKKKKKKKSGDAMETPVVDVNEMDADAGPSMTSNFPTEEEWDGTEEMRKRVLDQYMDEIHQLDFNDMVGGMPTRFKYAPVPKSKYGLSATQILLATDKELNSYVGMKSLAPHKKRDNWDSQRGKKLGDFKKAIAGRTWGYAGKPSRPIERASGPGGSKPGRNGADGSRKKKVKKGKRERDAEKAAKTADAVES